MTAYYAKHPYEPDWQIPLGVWANHIRVDEGLVGSELSLGLFWGRSETAHKGVGELGWNHARVSVESFGGTGFAFHAIRQKAQNPVPRSNTYGGLRACRGEW